MSNLKNMKKSVLIAILATLVGAFSVFFGMKAYYDKNPQPENLSVLTDINGKPAQFRTVNLSLDDYPDFTYAAESSVDAVVYVKVVSKGSANPNSIFDFFFGIPSQPGGRERVGSGSGVIIREDGYIVTNNHVIQGATKIEVTLNSNQTYEASLVGADPATDVALLKIDAKGLPTIPFGDSDQLRLGEWVLAIGSPYDLRSTITAGIVSAKGRSMPNYTGEFKIESFIQTDAAVNPGNSGGALVDKAGRLVGVNTAIISQTGSFAGYSFAIPSNIVRRIVSDLIDFGSVKRALLGVTMTSVNDKIAEEMKLSSLNGVYIVEVMKGGAADNAGIKEKDVIIAVDSTKITTASSLQEAVTKYSPGDKAKLIIVRDGKTKEVQVTFQGTEQETGTTASDGSIAFYGSYIKEASPETLSRLNLKSGVEIVSVGPGKMREGGAMEGFVITHVNDKSVSTPQDILNIAKKSKRAIFIEGKTPAGKLAYFGFGI